MARHARLAILIAIAITISASATGSSAVRGLSQSAFTSDVTVVPVYASALDERGRPVLDLTADDFSVRDSGRPVRLSVFSRDTQPLSVVVLLDTTLGPRVHRALQIAHAVIDSLTAADRAAVGSFGVESMVGPALTDDSQRLHDVVDQEIWPVGGVGWPDLWRAAGMAMDRLSGVAGRRVVLIVSGGFDGGRPEQVTRRAIEADAMVYGVLVENSPFDSLWGSGCATGSGCVGVGVSMRFDVSPPLSAVKRLSELTGGRTVVVRDGDDVVREMRDLSEEWRQQYLLGFVPERLDGKSHKIEVRSRRNGVSVRARQAYLAEAR